MPKLLVVDDHALVRQGLAQALADVPGVVTVMEAADAEAALQLFERHGAFDVVVLDLMLPGISGLSLMGVLRRRYPGVRVVVVSALDGDGIVGRARSGGAAEFVCKARPVADLVAAVARVVAGDDDPASESAAGEERGEEPYLAYRSYGLTVAQCRVLEFLVQGKSNRHIGWALGLSEGTVKVHVTAILKALDVSSRTQAVLKIASLSSAR